MAAAPRVLRVLVAVVSFGLAMAPFARAAEVIPPAPRDHFNDYAGIVRRDVALQLNRELTEFERSTSNQIVVAVFPRMQSGSSIEDYTVRVFEAWRPGAAQRNNGAALFVFRDDRKVRIVTGYGLEGVLPDALCKQIIENEITPRFRTGDFTGGLAAGTRALMSAARGEYRGVGRTVAEARPGTGGRGGGGVPVGLAIPFFVVFVILLSLGRALRGRSTVYHRRGRGRVWSNAALPWLLASAMRGRRGGGGGGWSGGGGGGSFSGGGGRTGGGGAGGSW